MLHATSIRSTIFGVFSVAGLVVTISAVAAPAVAASLSGRPGFHSKHLAGGFQSGSRLSSQRASGQRASGQRTSGQHTWIAGGERHRFGLSGGKHGGTALYPGSFGYPWDYGQLAGFASGTVPPSRDDEGRDRPRPAGPISFGDLPASTGVKAAPLSDPLFLRISGRQVVADDGERHLWRAGPATAGHQGAKVTAAHRQDGYRTQGSEDPNGSAPKIIVIRP